MLWEKEKLPVTSNFSFSNNVFRSSLLLMCQNEYRWSKGLKLNVYISCSHDESLHLWFDFHETYITAKLFTTQCLLLITLTEKLLENNVGKGENGGNQHFVLSPQCLLPIPERISVFKSHFLCCLQML